MGLVSSCSEEDGAKAFGVLHPPCPQVIVSKELSHLVPVTARQGSSRANFGMTPVVLAYYLRVWQIHILDLNVYGVIWQPWH